MTRRRGTEVDTIFAGGRGWAEVNPTNAKGLTAAFHADLGSEVAPKGS